MNLKSLISPFILGFIHGILSLYGLVMGWEIAIWMLIAIYSILLLIFFQKTKIFLNGLAMGFLVTLATGMLQWAFLDMYLTNNPTYMADLDQGTDYSTFILLFTPIFGAIYGIIIGAVGLALSKMKKA